VHSVTVEFPADLPKKRSRKEIVKKGLRCCLWAESNLQHPKAYEFDYRIVHLTLEIEYSREAESTIGMMSLFVPIVHYLVVCFLC
jgi:hypothetical protein